MKKIIFLLSLLMAFSASAKDCEQEESMSAARVCSLNESELPVELAYKKLVKSSKNKDSISAIKKAQSDWRKYRDSSCQYVSTIANDGGYQEDAVLICQIEFNEARVKILTNYANKL